MKVTPHHRTRPPSKTSCPNRPTTPDIGCFGQYRKPSNGPSCFTRIFPLYPCQSVFHPWLISVLPARGARGAATPAGSVDSNDRSRGVSSLRSSTPANRCHPSGVERQLTSLPRAQTVRQHAILGNIGNIEAQLTDPRASPESLRPIRANPCLIRGSFRRSLVRIPRLTWPWQTCESRDRVPRSM